MRNSKLVPFIAIAMLSMPALLRAATIHVDNSNMLPNTAGQTYQINVTGIAPNTVNGIAFSVAINEGGPANGGWLGPKITAIDIDSGPTIWVPPNSVGHILPNLYFDPGGQLAHIDFLTTTGFVNVSSGLLVTLTIDWTGMHGFHQLTLSGGVIPDIVGDTELIGLGSTTIDYAMGTYASINDAGDGGVPEPSSLILGLFALAGLAAVAIRKQLPVGNIVDSARPQV